VAEQTCCGAVAIFPLRQPHRAADWVEGLRAAAPTARVKGNITPAEALDTRFEIYHAYLDEELDPRHENEASVPNQQEHGHRRRGDQGGSGNRADLPGCQRWSIQVYTPKPVPFGGMGKPLSQNGFSDHFLITMTVTDVAGVDVGELPFDSIDQRCKARSPIGSGRRDTPCTVICIPAACAGTRKCRSMRPTVEATASATAVGGSKHEVSQAPPWDHSASVSAQ
jgi:hypothetical protein